MVPKQISLKNFLSYREASLDFEGIHVACIAGPNGAGKSSLLEAMSWAMWGQSRVAADDDVIHQGEMEARVVFLFNQRDQVYRIIRSRHRIQGSSLEFQLKTEEGYRVLTQRGVRATQRLICHHLKLDYDTFINSAYLRQGRADDFMLKRPSERKQILADLLKLERYDGLVEQAKEYMRQAKAEAALRQTQIEAITKALNQQQIALKEQATLQEQQETLTQQQLNLQQRLVNLRQQKESVQWLRQQLQLKQQQYQHLEQQQQQVETTLTDLNDQLDTMNQVLHREAEIEAGLKQLVALETEDAALEQQFKQYQAQQTLKQELETALENQVEPLKLQLRRLQIRRDFLNDQLKEGLPVVRRQEEIENARQQLVAAKRRLHHLDALQLQAEPLLHRRQRVQAKLQQESTRLQTRLEEIDNTLAHLTQQQDQEPDLDASVQAVSQTLDYLEQRRTYQEQVREKGQERRRFMESLQANQRTYEAQLAQVEQKLQWIHQPKAVCPVCDRRLDASHRTLVEDRHRLQQQELRNEIIVIREQLAVTEREIQVLRQEYRAIEVELELYAPVLQKRGRLEAQLSTRADLKVHLRKLEQERQSLQTRLDHNDYSTELQTELQQLNHTLAQLAYDDRDHALVRGQVDRLRWAEIKHHEMKQTQDQQSRLKKQKQTVLDDISRVEAQLQAISHSSLQQKLKATLSNITQLNYDSEHHQQVRQQLKQAHTWRLQRQEFERAQKEYSLRQAHLQELLPQREAHTKALVELSKTIHLLEGELRSADADFDQAEQWEADLQRLQHQREELMACLGALQHQKQQFEELQAQQQQQEKSLSEVRQQQRIYHELAQAFGRNGIQAMMIENLLPQLEAETNHLLGRLSDHQLHVRFVTQRASKRRQHKPIDTLDIHIADAKGTRPYETYSGGEAFRVNFAVRLALSRLLAQRSGLALKLLIIDEGFGTQDQQGCERLIGAINAIADDFACIMAVTHIPHFREAFQTRIDISKGQDGSHILMSS